MSKDSLHERGKALEDAFFDKRDRELLRQLREKASRDEQRAALSAASGIANQQLLDHLIDLNVKPETIAALSLIPLVVVAWADRVLDAKERDAISEAARKSGLNEEDPGFQLLQTWFDAPPTPDTVESWKHYVQSLEANLTTGGREQLKKEVIERAHHVAAAAGGILGLGGNISRAEKQALAELEAVFD